MVPFQIGADVVFLETHGAFETFNRTKTVDPFLQGLFGGGIRKRLPGDAMIGVTGFYNLIRVAGKWHGTPIVGGELAWLTAGSGVISLTVNQYGGISAVDYVDQFVKGRGDFKIEASYQQAFVRDVCDIRLRLNGYTVRRDEDIRGWNAGFDLIGVDRVLTLRFEGGHDKLSGAYYSGSCVVTLGLQLENLMCGVSPFVKP
jgi:hypothetical protein